MTYEEAKDILRVAAAEVEWNCPLDYTEAFKKAEEALDKQIPKKPRETRCALMCANCGHKITEKWCKKLSRSYCKVCGQAIDWSKNYGKT